MRALRRRGGKATRRKERKEVRRRRKRGGNEEGKASTELSSTVLHKAFEVLRVVLSPICSPSVVGLPQGSPPDAPRPNVAHKELQSSAGRLGPYRRTIETMEPLATPPQSRAELKLGLELMGRAQRRRSGAPYLGEQRQCNVRRKSIRKGKTKEEGRKRTGRGDGEKTRGESGTGPEVCGREAKRSGW